VPLDVLERQVRVWVTKDEGTAVAPVLSLGLLHLELVDNLRDPVRLLG
jgi:hypothetical protein